MEDNKTILTEENLKDITDVLDNEAKNNSNISLVREIEDGSYESDEDTSTIFDEVEGEIEGTTGVDLYEAAIDKVMTEEDKEAAAEELAGKYNLPVSDIMTLIDISRRWKANEKFSLYNSLPEKVKGIINLQLAEAGALGSNESRSLYCNLFMEEFTSEIMNKYFDKEVIDLNKSVQETLGGITNITDMYAGHIRYMMEVELRDMAEKAKTEEAKKIYLDCSDAFIDSYHYNRMLDALEVGKIRRKVYKDNFQYNRYCSDFDYKNKDTKYSIRNIDQMAVGLVNNLGKDLGINTEDAKAFTILFIKTTDNMDMHELKWSTYAYYSIFNIINLGFDINKSKFYQAVTNNIKKVFNTMWDKCGDTRHFEVEDDINWVEDEPTPEEIESYKKDLENTLTEE